MIKKYSNTCSRCGTERIIVRTWKEKIYDSVVINTQTACPNPECQKKVDSDNKKLSDQHIAMKLRSQRRATEQKANRHKLSP